jgi:hypothetical protein
MIRLSVTHLETLRYWKGREDATMQMLIADLTYKSAPTRQMQAGKAFQKFLELAKEGESFISTTVEGWSFYFGDLALLVPIPLSAELKGYVDFATPHGLVRLTGVADDFRGMEIGDNKLTEKIEAEKYLDSLQWRAYLVMFGASKFVYHVFQGRYDKDEDNVTITGYETFPFYTYPGIRRDVERAVAELAGIVAEHNIEALIEREAA